MRKEYRKAVRECFARGMCDRLPRFAPVKVKSDILSGGESVFRWVPAGALHCYVILMPDSKGRQAFTLELAWSGEARFPSVTMRPSLMLGPGDPDPLEVDEGILRLGDLVDRSDRWWSLPDPALEHPGDLEALQESLRPVEAAVARARAAGPVGDALTALVNSGVGFFEALAARHAA